MQKKKLSRRERLRASCHREILDAAQDLFTANGYHNVTMSQIAEKAEFSVGTLYNFFKNKEDLYHSLVLEKCKEYSAIQYQALNRDVAVLERVREFLSNATRFFLDNTALIRILLAETRGESFNLKSKLRKDARQIMYELADKVTSVMEEGIRKNIFRKFDPLHLTLALEGICQNFLFHFTDNPDQHPQKLQTDIIFDLFARGALADAENSNSALDV